MLLKELFDHLLAENIGNTTLVIAPLLWYLIESEWGKSRSWVRPK